MKPQPEASRGEVLAGLVERVTYHNPENGFCVVRANNGDIGSIDDVDPNAGVVVANFDRRSVTYGFGELDVLVPAYAATIHKSQGSDCPPAQARGAARLRHADTAAARGNAPQARR